MKLLIALLVLVLLHQAAVSSVVNAEKTASTSTVRQKKPAVSKVSYQLTVVSNANAQLFISESTKVSLPTANTVYSKVLKSVDCSDLYITLFPKLSTQPLAVAVKIVHKGKIYATRQVVRVEKAAPEGSPEGPPGTYGWNYLLVTDPTLRSVRPLYVAANALTQDGVKSGKYNTEDWGPARIVDRVLDDNPPLPFLTMRREGAMPLSNMDGFQSDGPVGLRVFLPFCQKTPFPPKIIE